MNNNVRGVNKPAAVSKRLLSGTIDVLLVFLFSYLIFTFIATPIANNNFELNLKNSSLADYQEEYYKIARDEYNILESYERDGNSFEIVYTDEYNDLSNEKREELVNKFHENEDVKVLVDNINNLSNEINGISNMMVIFSTFIVEVIFWLVIPLANKKKKSLGMMIVKLEIIHRDDMEVSKKQIVYRFLSLYILQTVIFYFIFGVTVVFISPLIGLLTIYASVNRYSIHDMIAKTKVVGENPILFQSIEERDNYALFNLAKKKSAIDAEIVSKKDNDKIIEEDCAKVDDSTDDKEIKNEE